MTAMSHWSLVGHNVSPDRKSTRLNSSHPSISYAVFCLKKKTIQERSDAKEIVAVAVSDIERGQDLDARCDPILQGVRLLDGDRGVDAHGVFFFFNDTATTEIYTLSLHDALPI